MDVEELTRRVRAKVERQRKELEADPRFRELRENERFLERLEDEIAAVAPTPSADKVQATATLPPTADHPGNLRKLKAGEKGEAIVSLLKLHGRVAPKVLREQLRDQGIDPDAGTEVKRVLWQLAKEGKIRRHPDAGEYSLPDATPNGSSPVPEELRL